jgi:hypothetical protein
MVRAVEQLLEVAIVVNRDDEVKVTDEDENRRIRVWINLCTSLFSG